MTEHHEMRYTVISGTLEIEGELRESFGIGLRYGNEKVRDIPDISADRDAVDRMVSLFNETQPAEVHLFDIIEDMLP